MKTNNLSPLSINNCFFQIIPRNSFISIRLVMSQTKFNKSFFSFRKFFRFDCYKVQMTKQLQKKINMTVFNMDNEFYYVIFLAKIKKISENPSNPSSVFKNSKLLPFHRHRNIRIQSPMRQWLCVNIQIFHRCINRIFAIATDRCTQLLGQLLRHFFFLFR